MNQCFWIRGSTKFSRGRDLSIRLSRNYFSESSRKISGGNHPQEQGLRINKALTAHYSRREIDKLVAQRKIRVNGKYATLGQRISASDEIEIDGTTVWNDPAWYPQRSGSSEAITKESWFPHVYLKFWKPKGVICTADSSSSGPTSTNNIFNCLARLHPGILAQNRRIFSIGRLDVNTTGLLLLTSNGDLCNSINHSDLVPKTYETTLDRNLSSTDLNRLRKGVHITSQVSHDGNTKNITEWISPLRVVPLARKREVEVTIREGRNRQLHHMFQSLNGSKIVDLIRIQVGDVTLRNLKGPGDCCPLNKQEKKHLFSFQKKSY